MYIEEILKRYKINKDVLIQKVIPYIVRDFSVIWMCESKLSKEFKIEVYGWGWENYPQVEPFYKGELSYGQALVDVYSSAKEIWPHILIILFSKEFWNLYHVDVSNT